MAKGVEVYTHGGGWNGALAVLRTLYAHPVGWRRRPPGRGRAPGAWSMADSGSRAGGRGPRPFIVTRGEVPCEGLVRLRGAVVGRGKEADGAMWQMTTEGSEYTLDLAGGRVRRTPVAAAGLRGDGTWVRLLGVLDVRVGHPMVLVLLLRDDGISTIRYSSRVLRVRRLTSPLEKP